MSPTPQCDVTPFIIINATHIYYWWIVIHYALASSWLAFIPEQSSRCQQARFPSRCCTRPRLEPEAVAQACVTLILKHVMVVFAIMIIEKYNLICFLISLTLDRLWQYFHHPPLHLDPTLLSRSSTLFAKESKSAPPIFDCHSPSLVCNAVLQCMHLHTFAIQEKYKSRAGILVKGDASCGLWHQWHPALLFLFYTGTVSNFSKLRQNILSTPVFLSVQSFSWQLLLERRDSRPGEKTKVTRDAAFSFALAAERGSSVNLYPARTCSSHCSLYLNEAQAKVSLFRRGRALQIDWLIDWLI